MLYKYVLSSDYIWLFPFETIKIGAGICIDTTNMVQSMLEYINYPSFAVIGEVRKADTNELLGYHAWVETEHYVWETTIHLGQGRKEDILIPKEKAYTNYKNLKYVAWYTYNSKMTKKEKVGLILLRIFGKGGLYENFEQFRKMEIVKQKFIWKKEVDK
jgi:hypothetical protein